MGVATGCGFKEIYRFPHTTYPYSSCICPFLQQHPYFFGSFLKMFFVLYIYILRWVIMCIVKPLAYLWKQTGRLCWHICSCFNKYSYMINLVHNNLCMAKLFSDTVRYIDDLLTVNNSNFEEEITNIRVSFRGAEGGRFAPHR